MTSPTLSLDGEVIISTAADWRLALQSGVNALGDEPEARLALDLSGVGALDSAGVQLLLATRHSLAARAQQLQIVASNPTVNDVLHALGLGGLLDGECPTAPQGAPA